MRVPEKFSVVVIVLLMLCMMSALFAGDVRAEADGKPLAGRHRIELGFGMLADVDSDTYTVPGETASNVSVDGPAFSMGYAYWPSEQWSLGVEFSVLGVEASHSVTAGQVTNETSTVVPFLFSIGVQPTAIALSPGVRPFFTAGIGSFTGVRTKNTTGPGVTSLTRTESTLGAHFGAGVDCLLSRLISLSFSGGYYLVSEFDEPVSGQTDYSTPEFTVSLGFNFGKGKK